MDYQRKKVLTQSVAYIQAHLNISPELLTSLKQQDVLTDEEISTIQKDDTISGKILELLCFIKRKDSRSYSRFTQVLEEQGCNDIVQLLRNKDTPADDQACDPRTAQYLESFLSKTTVNQQKIDQLSSNLVLKQIHRDEMKRLQDKIAELEACIKARGHLHSESSHSTSSDTGSDRSTPTSRSTPISFRDSKLCQGPSRSLSNAIPEWDIPSKVQELEVIIKQKDDIIRRREEEYNKLKKIVTATQDDLQSVLDLNNQYLSIIEQMNRMQMHSAVTSTVQDKDTSMLEMERKLEETEHLVGHLQDEIMQINDELDEKKSELDRTQKREKRFKDRLGLPSDATEDEIDNKIKKILEDGSMCKNEVEKIEKELKKVIASRNTLQEKYTTLVREKEKIEFHMRQQELTLKKMKRMRIGNHVLQNAEQVLAAHGYDRNLLPIRLPNIQRPGSQLSLAASKAGSSHQYCIFCRTEYQPMKAQNCRIHFRPIRGGQWMCCKDDCHRSAGCLQVPHFYIEITADKKVFLTDGARYMELT